MKKIFLLCSITVFVISCQRKSTLTDEQVEKYTKHGKEIAQSSFKALSSQLKQVMQAGGVKNAASYCNVAALPLTDSLSNKYNAVIKRTSLKLRNPKNAPDSLEAKMLAMYLIMSRMRNPVMVPKILEKNAQEVQFYAPIMIKSETCLKCHGIIDDTMQREDYGVIAELYPNDAAIGYKLGDFRGMWSITLKK